MPTAFDKLVQMPDLVLRPSLTEFLCGMGTRIQENRAPMVVLLAMAARSLVSMEVMSRGVVPALLVIPALNLQDAGG